MELWILKIGDIILPPQHNKLIIRYWPYDNFGVWFARVPINTWCRIYLFAPRNLYAQHQNIGDFWRYWPSILHTTVTLKTHLLTFGVQIWAWYHCKALKMQLADELHFFLEAFICRYIFNNCSELSSRRHTYDLLILRILYVIKTFPKIGIEIVSKHIMQNILKQEKSP